MTELNSKSNIKPNIMANIGLGLGRLVRFVLPLIFVFAALALFLLIGLPSFRKLDLLKVKKADTEKKLLSLETRRKNLEKVSAVAGSLEDNLTLVDKALPEDSSIPALLSQIQQISAESGVELSSLQYSGSYKDKISEVNTDSEKSKNETKILVQASVAGDYKQISTFFEALEFARRILSFENIKLTADSKGDLSIFQVSLGLSGYYMKSDTISAQSAMPAVSAIPTASTVSEIPGAPAGAIPGVSEEASLKTTLPVALEFNSKEFNKVLEGLRTFREYENMPLDLNVVNENKTAEEVPGGVTVP